MILKNNSTLFKRIPESVGVYQFLNRQKQPIYIGKAINLKKRLKQHFQAQNRHKEKLIVEQTEYIKLHQTDSEFQALLFEANLIRKYQPKYNAVLLDDKSRLYIVVKDELYPKVRLCRQRDLAKQGPWLLVFGPLSSSGLAKQLLRKVRQAIPFCTEKKLGRKPCFYSQINLCHPCPNFIHLQPKKEQARLKKQYNQNIKKLIKLFQGRGESLLNDWQKELNQLSVKQRYEEAAVLRDRIFYLQALFQRRLGESSLLEEPLYQENWLNAQSQSLQKLLKLPKLHRIECYDISNLNFKEATASMVVFEQGKPNPQQYRRFQIKGARRFDPEMLVEVLLRRFQHPEWPKADLIVIDGGLPQLTKIAKVLTKYQNVPYLVGLAKRPDRLVDLKQSGLYDLKNFPQALALLQRVRDEAHRFAKKYHLYLRHKTLAKMLSQIKAKNGVQ